MRRLSTPAADERAYQRLTDLSSRGWFVCVTHGFAGGILLIAEKNGHQVQRQGATVWRVIGRVLAECERLDGVAA